MIGNELGEVNRLRTKLREQELKCENQAVLLRQNETELRDIKVKYRKLQASAGEQDGGIGGSSSVEALLESTRRTLGKREKEVEALEVSVEKLKGEKGGLVCELEDLKGQVVSLKKEMTVVKSRLEITEESFKSIKAIAFQFEEENVALKTDLLDKSALISDLRASVKSKEDVLGSLESEAKIIGKQKSDINAAKKETNRNRKQLLLLAESANRMQSDLGVSLSTHKRLLDELKMEYEEHAETVRAEWNMDRKAKMEDYNKLRQQCENLKLIQFEDKQQLLREQREVVKALQTQFEEYRETAEFLFQTEASKLENKVRMQGEKYEEEIRYIVKAKDQHFDAMMSAKDAKIMNLIEGSDMQTILIKHEQELEQMRRSHVDELEMVRLRTEAEQRGVIVELRQQLLSNEAVEEKLKLANDHLELRLEEAIVKQNGLLEQMARRDEEHLEELQKLQDLVQDAHVQKERLNQEKQDLRHRIVRLKFKAKGDADETLPNLVKRLTIEASNLRGLQEDTTHRISSTVSELKMLRQKYIIQSQHLEHAKALAALREKELKSMVSTLSKALYFRARSLAESPTRPSGKSKKENIHSAVSTLQRVLDGNLEENWILTREDLEDPAAVGGPGAASAPVADGREEVSPRAKRAAQVSASVKTRIPAKLRHILEGADADVTGIERVDRSEILELARGINYLKRFQQVSSAFTSGTMQQHVVKEKAAAPSTSAYEKNNTIRAPNDILGHQKDEWWKDNILYANLG